MGRIRRGGYIIKWFIGDHPPRCTRRRSLGFCRAACWRRRAQGEWLALETAAQARLSLAVERQPRESQRAS